MKNEIEELQCNFSPGSREAVFLKALSSIHYRLVSLEEMAKKLEKQQDSKGFEEMAKKATDSIDSVRPKKVRG